MPSPSPQSLDLISFSAVYLDLLQAVTTEFLSANGKIFSTGHGVAS